MEAYMISPDWLENFHSFFSASFLLAKESDTISGQLKGLDKYSQRLGKQKFEDLKNLKCCLGL